jgi:hypothetical protein
MPSEADRDRLQQAGFDHHFVKPVNLKQLSALLTTAAASLQPSAQAGR